MNDMRQATAEGRRIEEASFALIDAEAGPHGLAPDQWEVARRVIHATGDLEFARTLAFHGDPVAAGTAALRAGSAIVCDVRMIAAGLNAARLAAFRCEVRCLIDAPGVAEAAHRAGSTRAAAAMRAAWREGLLDGALVAVGNAPSALAELCRLCQVERARPAVVLAVPVGFVGAAEAKEAALDLPVPAVVARGRKGGSPVAVAAIHALLSLAAVRP